MEGFVRLGPEGHDGQEWQWSTDHSPALCSPLLPFHAHLRLQLPWSRGQKLVCIFNSTAASYPYIPTGKQIRFASKTGLVSGESCSDARETEPLSNSGARCRLHLPEYGFVAAPVLQM